MFVKERFALNKYTVDLLKDLEPGFGFGQFGEFVFYRTYSRYIDGYQETWADCVIRVISGCMSIRKDWYIKNGISWDEKWWQQYAKKMAISLFKMEWMAPGRGLWAMGTEFVYERGSMALNNCFVGDTLIVTDQGVMTLLQAVGMGSIENQRLKVIGKDGQWHYATVRCFGEQQLNVMRLSNGLTYTVTENHRWLLADGSETTQLKVGDEIEIRPIEFTNDEREFNDGYVHALVYLNGRQSHSFLYDLTIKDSKYRSMILDSKFYNSDRDDNYTLVTEDNLKSTPKGTTNDSYKRGFMMGLLIHGKLSMANKWVTNYAVSLGYNYINGALTILPTIVTVESIIRTNVIDHVYCVVEPETHSFMLAGGIVCGNCGYTEVHDLLSDDIGWTMDSMMLGLGIGFTPVRNDKLEFKRSHGTGNDFVIPDSREGWVESEVRLIDALRLGLPKPRMIYDEVREAGLPIKGFGGISSGPEPLMELHERTEELMNMYMEDKYYDSVMLKTDLQNNVGVAVVSGNVRRSAELAKNSIKDPTFRDLKNYEDPKYRYRRAFGWMSNNSVDLEDDEDFELLGEVAKRVITRGEPGICNLQNFKYGRVGKKDNVRPDRGRGTNACFVADTKIGLADGRGFVPAKDLIGQDADVYCVSDNDEITIKRMRNVRLTGEKKKVLKVTFDTGDSIRVTEDHRFMLRDRSLREAKDLEYGDSLVILSRYIPENCLTESYYDKYISLSYSSKMLPEHKLIAENKYHYIDGSEHVHHIDENRFNNHPNNLELKEGYNHLADHSKGIDNPNYSGYTEDDLIEFGISLCLKLNRRFSTDEWLAEGPIKNLGSKFRKERFKSIAEFASFCADAAGVFNEQYDTRTLRFYQDMINLGYDCEIINKKVHVEKKCEVCSEMFWINAQEREQAVCSLKCSAKRRDHTKRQDAYRQTIAERNVTLREQQLNIYVALKLKLNRMPTKAEWKQECKDNNVKATIGLNASPFSTYFALSNTGDHHNHRVVAVVEDGYEDVYNGTVDDYHNLFLGGWERENQFGRQVQVGVCSPQCGEVILEGGVDLDGKSRVRELCNQAETLPTNCKDVETWLRACEYATLYASTVSLLPTHQPSTNRVIARNRRISIGIIDFSGWKHETSLHHVTKCLRLGYNKVREINKRANGEAGVPESIRVTTIKPGGTVPKLPGKTPGIGHPTFTYTLRRVNVAKNSPLMPLIIEAGVPYEDSVTDKYSYITEWPILQGPALPGENVSLWEQAMDLVLVQREWADNAVSNTLYFKPKWVLFKLIGELIEIRGFLCNHIINEDDYIKAIVKIESEEDEIFVQDLKITYNSDDGYKIYKYNPHHEEHHIEPVLSAIAPLTKTVSLLPHTAAGVYAQMPEEGISKEEYERRLAAIKKIDWSQLKGSDGSDERYCQGSQCEMPIKE